MVQFAVRFTCQFDLVDFISSLDGPESEGPVPRRRDDSDGVAVDGFDAGNVSGQRHHVADIGRRPVVLPQRN